MALDQHREEAPSALRFALIVATDTRTAGDDRTTPLVRERVTLAGHELAAARRVPNEIGEIQDALRQLLIANGIDVVVVSGGTGFSPRDVTVEAIRPLLERTVDGFGELFRALSFAEIGAAAMLSRALAGTAHRRAVFVLPGSPQAVALALERLILPEAAHLVAQLRR
ncbi:MAG: MogA/MoaB family molybdenum cofactor biosynthesis protein [Acidobacteriota bacterium]